ncbi:mucin-4-like isoform X1 [Macrosteles quadrilineatus]|uniref:mucin-4-like isoform X1 n=1 Tax=Macrosteles quadrilineatus TaxID=74068 RepID=UPI0023E1E64D|nr:mucin-4-like isoform X1 [Macrosteles quadrilineatus]
MGAPQVPQVLQIFQQATRNTVGVGSGVSTMKTKQPPQILPKPPGSAATPNKQSAPQPSTSPAITIPAPAQQTILLNQMIPGGVGPMLVQQQTSSGVQLILRSPPPQHTTKQPTVVLSNGPQPTVLVQHNPSRAQAQPQLVRLVTGQTLQLQHIQTSSGPALIAVPAPTTPTPPPQPSSPKNKLKKKKKKEDEGPTRLDLANLMKLSGIDDDDMAPVSVAQQTQTPQQSPTPPPPPQPTPPAPTPPSPKQPQPTIITPSQCTNQGLRVSVGEDGRMILHQTQPQVSVSGGVTPSIAAAAQSQLAQLLASHGDSILQNNSSLAGAPNKDSAALLQSLQTAVLSWANTDSLVMKAAGGQVALAQAPQVVINTGVRRPANTPSVVVANPQLLDTSHNGVIINGLHDRVLLSEQQNRVQIVTSVPHSSVSFSDQNRFHTIVSRAPSSCSTSMSLEQQNRVQIVSGVPTSTTMSLTEQQNRVQIVSGSQMSTGMSLTDQQSRVQIVSGVPSANSLSLTEQQNRVQIVSGVPNSTLTEQQNRVQIVSGIPSSSSVSLTEQNRVQIVSGVANPAMSLSEQNRVQIVSAVPHSSAMSLEQQNRVQIVSGVHSSSAMSMTEQQNRVQIVSGITNKAMSLTEQQNRVQIISSVPSANSMSLTEQQNRVQIVSGMQNTNSLSLEQQNRVQIVSGMQAGGMSLAEQQNRVHIVSGVANSSLSCEQNRVQIVSGMSNSTGIQINEQPTNRVHVVSASTNTTEHPSRVQIVSGIPNRTATSLADRIHVVQNDQSRVQIANSVPGLTFSDHQNRLHIVSGNTNSNPVLSEQNRVQIVTGVPNTNILSLSEQQSRVQILSNTSHNSVSLAPEQQRVQLVAGLSSDPTVQIITSMANTDHSRITGSSNLTLNEHQRLQVVTSLASSGGISDQQRVHILSNTSNDRLRPHIEPQRQMQSSGVQTVEQSLRPQYQLKPLARSPQMPQYHQQTVISPRCNPVASPQSPRGSNSKSPIIYPSHSPQQNQQPSPQQQQQTQQPKPSFSNRPNLIVVTQSSPSQFHHSSQTTTSQSQATQHEGHTIINHYPPQFVSKPTPTHTSQPHLNHQMDTSNHNHPSVITSLASCQTTTAITKPLQAVTRQPQTQRLPTTTSTSTATTTTTSIGSSYQNSFLDTIAQSHPSLVINKSPTPPIASKALKPKKLPKKSAVVKPMMHEERTGTPPCEKEPEPPSLVPISTQCEQTHTPNIQRVQTIQLTPQKQQHLKAVQNQIQLLSSKKPRTPQENQSLQRLFMEQQKILFSGKLIPTIPGQHAQGITFQVSTPVRVLPAPPSSPRQPPPPPPPVSAPPPPPPPPPPPTVSKATSPIHVQVGTQTSCEPSPSPPTLSLAKRATLIDQQQRADRQGATAPDVNTPFAGTSDAVKRLVRYHCLDEPVFSEGDLQKADEIFEATARHLLDKNQQMLNKYRYLLLMESMRQVQTSELIMLGRMFVSDETARLEAVKLEASAPTPPVKKEREDKTSPVVVKKEPEDHSHHHHNHGGGGDQLTRSHDRAVKREREEADDGVSVKKHCADDEEINAQVQNAIDSILNLGNKGSDPVIDEAVRSILSS